MDSLDFPAFPADANTDRTTACDDDRVVRFPIPIDPHAAPWHPIIHLELNALHPHGGLWQARVPLPPAWIRAEHSAVSDGIWHGAWRATPNIAQRDAVATWQTVHADAVAGRREDMPRMVWTYTFTHCPRDARHRQYLTDWLHRVQPILLTYMPATALTVVALEEPQPYPDSETARRPPPTEADGQDDSAALAGFWQWVRLFDEAETGVLCRMDAETGRVQFVPNPHQTGAPPLHLSRRALKALEVQAWLDATGMIIEALRDTPELVDRQIFDAYFAATDNAARRAATQRRFPPRLQYAGG